MTGVKIVGVGHYAPERIVDNHDLEQWLDTSDEWITTRTGMKRRHWTSENEATSDLALAAARNALASAKLEPNDIDAYILCTVYPDYLFPATACIVASKLGARDKAAFDMEIACSGFIYALAVADMFVRTGAARRALVVGSEVLSRIVDQGDRSTAILFGDGAGAVVLAPAEQPGIISTHLHADGSYKHLMYCTGGPSRGASPGNMAPGDFVRMAGSEVFKLAVTLLGRVVDETLAANKLDKAAIDWLVPHQANLRIIQAVAKKLDLPMERVIVTVQEHGNTSTASVPLALDVGVRDGRIKRGDMLLLEALGGGVTWGSALVRY